MKLIKLLTELTILKSASKWFAKPIEGIDGAVRLFLFIFVILPMMGTLVVVPILFILWFIGIIFGIDSTPISEGVCNGRYDADC